MDTVFLDNPFYRGRLLEPKIYHIQLGTSSTKMNCENSLKEKERDESSLVNIWLKRDILQRDIAHKGPEV